MDKKEKKSRVKFSNYVINDLEYKINDDISPNEHAPEEVETSCNNIEYSMVNDKSELYVRCDVILRTTVIQNDKKINFRNIKFKYIAKLIMENINSNDEVLDLFNKGAINLVLSHITDVIKSISSVDDRGLIIPEDFPFPNEDLNNKEL